MLGICNCGVKCCGVKCSVIVWFFFWIDVINWCWSGLFVLGIDKWLIIFCFKVVRKIVSLLIDIFVVEG